MPLRDSWANRIPLIGQSVAILDDDPGHLALLVEMFRNLGANVFAATDPGQFFSQLDASVVPPDLVLVGILLDHGTQLTNAQLLGQLQARYDNQDLPLVAMTADLWNAAVREFHEVAVVIEKPVNHWWVDAIARAMNADRRCAFRQRVERAALRVPHWNWMLGRGAPYAVEP